MSHKFSFKSWSWSRSHNLDGSAGSEPKKNIYGSAALKLSNCKTCFRRFKYFFVGQYVTSCCKEAILLELAPVVIPTGEAPLRLLLLFFPKDSETAI
jgi:hypothetical protein